MDIHTTIGICARSGHNDGSVPPYAHVLVTCAIQISQYMARSVVPAWRNEGRFRFC